MNNYQQQNPRYDLLTNEVLEYKSKEQYLNSYYNNRKNLIKHFKQSPKIAEKITSDILKSIISIKNISDIPSTIECKTFTCPCPSPALLYSLNVNYINVGKKIKLNKKFLYEGFNNLSYNKLTNKIYIDSREQTPFEFNCETEVAGLKFGDYSTSLNLKDILVIERKSGNDFIGTMSKGYERFCKELEKSRNGNCQMLMIVENDINSMLSYNYLPQFKWVKAKPQFIFSRLRSLLQAFNNFQVLFCKNKTEAAFFTHLILSNPNIFNWDIQYLYETKQIKHDSI